MPYEYLYWLSEKHFDELIIFLWAFLLFDTSRYALLKILVAFIDIIKLLFRINRKAYTYCPSISVLLSGYNEFEGIKKTLKSIYGSYPILDIIAVDDGSTDNTYESISKFADQHFGVLALKREQRGGKASALNYAFNFAKGDIIIVIDSDSTLGENAIWEIVQPFKSLTIGGVSGNLAPRNIFTNLLTWLQAYEYLHSIFVGRLVSSRLDILGIVSGAFGAFRREAWERCGGMDVGPPEDLDFTIKIRKMGYKVVFAEFATCYTDVPDTFIGFTKQRLRWEQGGVVRNYCRKHLNITNLLSQNFRLTNLLVWLEAFFFELISPYVILSYYVWLIAYAPSQDLIYIFVWLYAIYFCLELVHIFICMFYSQNVWRDLAICLVMPFMFFYRSYLVIIRALANTQELLWRVSYEDNYVPKHVREATWHW